MKYGPFGIALCAAVALAGCATPTATIGSGPSAVLPARGAVVLSHATTPIDHVVIVIQENRSFDNFFATYPGAAGTTTGRLHNGKTVRLIKGNLVGPELSNGYPDFLTSYDNGKMDGFDQVPCCGGAPSGTLSFQYVDPAQIKPYWDIAKAYGLADHLFQTQGSGSFTAHQDLIAGDTELGNNEALVDWPIPPQPGPLAWGCDAPKHTVTSLVSKTGAFARAAGPFPCLKYATIRDRLDAAGITWKYYSGPDVLGGSGYMWNAFEAIAAVRYGPEWSANISIPMTNIFNDISSGQLPNVSWVIPYVWDSDHNYGGGDTGPDWVAQVVDAVGQSPYWKSTAVVVVWDDWGGFYDHLKPPPGDYGGFGFRVPMLVVAPYVPRGKISHTQYEFGSILKFVENNWTLQPVREGDARAASIADMFDFSSPPRKFTTIATTHSLSFFLKHPYVAQPVDER